MSIRVLFGSASLNKPGAYSQTQILDSGVNAPALGIVALIGEADEGIPFSQETGLSAVTYGPDEMQAIMDKYGSGELVDAAKLAISPSPQIPGGAQQLLLLKTNQSTSAQLSINQGSSAYGVVKAMKPGVAGNQTSIQISIVANQAIISVSRLDLGVSEVSAPLGNTPVLSIQCTDSVASAAKLSISSSALSTTVTGGTAQSLNIPLASFTSVGQLASFISAQPGYTCTVASNKLSVQPVSILDQVSLVDIHAAAASIKQDAFEVKNFFAGSSLVNFVPSAFSGLPSTLAKSFLSGGSLGGSSAANVQSCIDGLLKAVRVNFIVPLFSQDAESDIPLGHTDPSSNYTISSIHAGVGAHVSQTASITGRKERQAWVGFLGNFLACEEQAAIINSNRVSMALQSPLILSASSGQIRQAQPHMMAVLAAGMHAAAPVGLPITFKTPAISGYWHTDFDPETMGSQAIDANLLFVETTPAGSFRFVLDNSTYANDLDSWIFNRPSVLYAADVAAYTIRLNTEIFVGQRNSDISVQAIINQLVGTFDVLRSAGIIVADNNTNGKGYKDLTVTINGSIVEVGVTLALVEGIEFVLSVIRVQRVG